MTCFGVQLRRTAATTAPDASIRAKTARLCVSRAASARSSDIRQIVIDTKDGIPIRVKDIARVQVGSLTRYGAVTPMAAAKRSKD